MTGAGHVVAIRAAAIYLPLAAVIAAGLGLRIGPRRWAAAVVSTAWNLVALLVVNAVAVQVGWWSFTGTEALVAGVPVELWLGWALLWGTLPALLPWRPAVIALGAVVLDLALMPLADPVVTLAPSWLVGEAIAVAVALGPGLVLTHLTITGRRPQWRAGIQMVGVAAVAGYVLPTLVFNLSGHGWSTLLDRSQAYLLVAAIAGAPAAAMAVQAVREMALAGGTPVPLDPPHRLITTGPYAYVANPMQLGATLLLALWGVVLGDPAVVATAAGAAAFSAGFARWQEAGDLRSRYGDAWVDYRRDVRCWIPRWRPFRSGEAYLATAGSCDPCREVGDAFTRLRTTGLAAVKAEDLPEVPRRATYRDRHHHEEGLAAIGRSLEHVNLGLATVSWLLRLPVVLPVLQLIADAVGAGPRDLGVDEAPQQSLTRPDDQLEPDQKRSAGQTT